MTSEERMAYYQKKKYGKTEGSTLSNVSSGQKRVQIWLSLLLLITFLTLDYSGCKICGIGSEEIIRYVTSNISMKNFTEFDFSLLGN